VATKVLAPRLVGTPEKAEEILERNTKEASVDAMTQLRRPSASSFMEQIRKIL